MGGRQSRRASLALVLAVVATGCGGAPSAPTEVVLARASSASAATEPPAAQAPTTPKGPSVESLVRELEGAEVWAVVEVGLLKEHPLADRIAAIMPYSRSLAACGIDAKSEFDRILVSDRSLSRHHDPMTIYEHHIDAGRVERFFDAAIDESAPKGKRVQIVGRSCAILHRHHLSGVACAASPTLLVVAFDPSPFFVESLAQSRGIGHPPPGEVAHATFVQPSRSMVIGSFQPPETLGTMEVGVKIDRLGGMGLVGRASSDNPARDAAGLQLMIDGPAGAPRVGSIPLPVPPIQFTAEGDEVVGRMPLARSDLDAAMALVELLDPL